MLRLLAHTRTWRQAAIVLAVMLALGFAGLPAPYMTALVTAAALALACVGIDLAGAYGGQFLFGQFGFVAIGAYGSTYLAAHAHLPFGVAMAAAIAVAGLIAAILACAVVRLAHFGATLATFFFGFVVATVLDASWLAPITQGENGLAAPAPSWGSVDLSAGRGLYLLSWGLAAVGTLAAYRYVLSRSGRALMLAKSHATVAGLMGVRVRLAGAQSIVFASMLAALGGAIYAIASGELAPESFTTQESTFLIAMVAVGGFGTIVGPILGAVFFAILPQWLNTSGSSENIIFAAALLAVLVLAPGGLHGLAIRAARLAPRRAPQPSIPPGPPTAVTTTSDGRAAIGGSALTEPGQRGTAAEKARPAAGLAVRGAAISYGGVRALDGVTMTVTPGSVHAIIGPNGAGKTTLLNAISGSWPLTEGSVLLDDARIDGLRPAAIRRLGLIRGFQHAALAPDLTVQENVMLGSYGDEPGSLIGDLLGWRVRARDALSRQRAAAALDLLGVPQARRGVRAADLSGAEAKLVDVARAFASRPRLLLLDEPTAGLSENEIERLARVLALAQRETGVTIIVIAHHIGFVEEIADDVTVLHFGRVLGSGKPADLLSDPKVREAFIGA